MSADEFVRIALHLVHDSAPGERYSLETPQTTDLLLEV